MTADHPATEPRTEAGRALLMGDPIAGGSYRIPHLDTCIWWKVGGQCDGDCGVLPAILAIEAEAAQGAAPRAAECCGHDPHGDDPCQATVSDWGDSYTGIPCPCDGRAAPRAEGLDVERLTRAIEIEDDRLPFLDAGIDSTATPRAVAEQVAERYARLSTKEGRE